MSKMKCPICETQDAEVIQDTDFYGFESIDCKRCGKCYIKKFIHQFLNENKLNFYKVSSWIREQNDIENIKPKIDEKKFDKILNSRCKKIKEKFDLMMYYFNSLDNNTWLNEKILVKCWIKDNHELDLLIKKGLNENLFEGKESTSAFGVRQYPLFKSLTFDGLQYLEELEEPNKNSKNIFVAFNFDNDLTDIFNIHLKEAIEIEGFKYTIVNQDTVEHNKSINDEIIVKLKTSKIVIADFTNHRNSVYFEAGYAMGMNIPIIWTCQEKHKDKMSFDTRQFPHIVWKDKDDLVKQVIIKIKRII